MGESVTEQVKDHSRAQLELLDYQLGWVSRETIRIYSKALNEVEACLPGSLSTDGMVNSVSELCPDLLAIYQDPDNPLADGMMEYSQKFGRW
jgi:hypothetical protein